MASTICTIDKEIISFDEFGVDHMTKDMNIVEFYSHLLHKFSGDRNQISDHLRTLGFMHNGFFNLDKCSETNDLTNLCIKLVKLSECWKATNYITNSHTIEEFLCDATLREAYRNSIVVVKYIEQYGARFWKNKWAREMRGTILFVNPETRKVKSAIKLCRGTEALTMMVNNIDIETQDIKSEKSSILDDEQKDTCKRLCENKPIDIYLTSKGDGSLLVITAYMGKTMNMIVPVIELFGNDYTRLWMKQSLKISQGKRIFLPSTQGTFIESGFMTAYMVTAMLCGSGIKSREELNKNHDHIKASYLNAWEIYGEEWIEKFNHFTFFDTLTDTQTFCFEAICKNRCGMFDDRPHTELACSYLHDRLIFLGTTICDKRFYIPHPLYETHSVILFEQPLWWKINHANQINEMLKDIGLMILSQMTKYDYLMKYPPANPEFNIECENQISNAIIDYEGWVAMKTATLEITDLDYMQVIETFKIPLTIYSKIKTEAYYRSHKFHHKNIPYLMELAKTAGDTFPLSRKIADIFTSDTITKRLMIIGQRIMKLLDFNNDKNEVLVQIRAAHQIALDNAQINHTKCPKDPLIGFENRTIDVQCKIVSNYHGFKFSNLLVPIYLELFTEIDPNTLDINQMCLSLTIILQPWTDDYNERIKKLNPYSTSIQNLMAACIGTTLVK